MSASWDWEPAAMQGDPVPEELGMVDKLAYISMRGVYAQYKSGRLTAQKAAQEKAEVKKLHQASVEAFKVREAIFDVVNAMLTDTADLRERMRTAQTAVEVALLGLDLCNVLAGRVTVTGHEAYVKAFELCGMKDQPPRQIQLN